MIILHCAERKKWEEESKSGLYGTHYITDLGFIPCMKAENIIPDNFSFSSMKDYLILCIDTDKVNAEIKTEIVSPNEYATTNIYGTISTNAVSTFLEYKFDSNDVLLMSREIEDIKIINEILEKLNIGYETHMYFCDGTSTRIILLNNKYVVRQNNPNLLESEVMFLKSSTTTKLQKVLYADKDYRYAVYNFIPGEVMHMIEDFDGVIKNIKEIISDYKPYKGEGFGYTYETYDTWGDFLKSIVHSNSLTLPESFDYLSKVYDAIAELDKYSFEKKLIHGDFGTHNFIELDGKFVGAIDPAPIAGDPLYDVLYALMSNVDFLPKVTIDFVSKTFSEPAEKVKALLIVVLFCRFAICLKYHKEDMDAYVDYWFNLIEQ